MKNLGMGMMRLPLLDENDFTSIDYEQVNQMVDAFMDAGFNYFDTAFIYHETVGEQAFKKPPPLAIHLRLQPNCLCL